MLKNYTLFTIKHFLVFFTAYFVSYYIFIGGLSFARWENLFYIIDFWFNMRLTVTVSVVLTLCRIVGKLFKDGYIDILY